VINLPAIAEEDEYIDGALFRRRGEALCPELRSLDRLVDMRETMGAWAFDTTMQGNPTSPDAFEWPSELFRNVFIESMPSVLNHLVVACDPATGRRPTHKGSDYTAIVALGAPGDGNFYVDAILRRTAFRQTIEGMAKLIGRLPRSVDAMSM
jgi:hypothetical protein